MLNDDAHFFGMETSEVQDAYFKSGSLSNSKASRTIYVKRSNYISLNNVAEKMPSMSSQVHSSSGSNPSQEEPIKS